MTEMLEIYAARGVSSDDARAILTHMARYKDVFIDHMLVQELGILPPTPTTSPAKQGLVTFAAFLVFGFIPLLSYVALAPIHWPGAFDPLFLLACIFTAVALFTLGAVAARFTHAKWWHNGLQVLLTGAAAAGVAYLAGYLYAQHRLAFVAGADGHSRAEAGHRLALLVDTTPNS